jgi:hypothetical protein
LRCLIRHITRKRDDNLVFQDREYAGDRLTIGRAADRSIFLKDLRVALEFAHVTEAGKGQFLITATTPSGVRVNDQVVGSALLSTHDVIGVRNYTITVKQPPAGFDLRLDVEQVKTTRSKELKYALMERSNIGLDRTGLRRRPWAWGLFIAVFVFFFVVPVTGYYSEPLRKAIRDSFLVGDATWDPGPLAPAHRFIGDDCNACHKRAFERIRNETCMSCHKTMRHHAEPALFAGSGNATTRCASCHKDHKAGRSFVRRDESLCADCHRRIKALAPQTTLADAASFGEAHPQFSPTLLSVEDGETRTTRVPIGSAQGMRERSNLRFPHDEHLAEEGLELPGGERRVLDCASCHVPEPGGMRMAPVDFEKHCHACHKLGFEDDDPAREVPHGFPDQVLRVLEDYYAGRALGGGYPAADAPQVIRRLRRPGSSLTEEERRESLEWVLRKSAQTARELFEFRACATCHTVTPVRAPAGVRPTWRLRPVRIATHWLPKARFTHARHVTMECADCHDARTSKSSEDVLLEGIETCRECHGGAADEHRLDSTCVDCHGFHISPEFLMGPGDAKTLTASGSEASDR